MTNFIENKLIPVMFLVTVLLFCGKAFGCDHYYIDDGAPICVDSGDEK